MAISLGMAALAVTFFRLATFTQQINPVDPGPAFYPRIVSLLLFAAAMTHAIRTWGQRRRRRVDPEVPTRERAGRGTRYIVGTLALCTLYVSLFNAAPYLVTTPPFLCAVMLLAGVRRWQVLCGSALGYALVTYYVFGQILMVPLP
jgi:hypothetical protein